MLSLRRAGERAEGGATCVICRGTEGERDAGGEAREMLTFACPCRTSAHAGECARGYLANNCSTIGSRNDGSSKVVTYQCPTCKRQFFVRISRGYTWSTLRARLLTLEARAVAQIDRWANAVLKQVRWLGAICALPLVGLWAIPLLMTAVRRAFLPHESFWRFSNAIETWGEVACGALFELTVAWWLWQIPRLPRTGLVGAFFDFLVVMVLGEWFVRPTPRPEPEWFEWHLNAFLVGMLLSFQARKLFEATCAVFAAVRAVVWIPLRNLALGEPALILDTNVGG